MHKKGKGPPLALLLCQGRHRGSRGERAQGPGSWPRSSNAAAFGGLGSGGHCERSGAVAVRHAPQRVSQRAVARRDRLVDVKRTYDPGNFFRHNQNIMP